MADDTITKRSFTPFLRRFARKFFWMLLVLWGITIVSFVVIHLAPGSPTDMETTLNPLAGEAGPPQARCPLRPRQAPVRSVLGLALPSRAF